jgi:hypothetical protein
LTDRRPLIDTETLEEAVIIVALIAPVFRYAVAFQNVEPPLQAGPWSLNISLLTGLSIGATYELAAYLGIKQAAAARKRGNSRWWWPLSAALLQIALGVFMITPVFQAQLYNVPLSSIFSGLMSWLWCAFVVAASLFTFVTIAAVQAVKPKPRKSAKPATQEQKTNGRETLACPWCGATCGKDGKPFRSQNGINAHAGKCAARERTESAAPAAVTQTQAEPVKRYSSVETEFKVPVLQAGIIAVSYSISIGLFVSLIVALGLGPSWLLIPLSTALIFALIFSYAVTVLLVDQRKLHRKPGQKTKAERKPKRDSITIENIKRGADGHIKGISYIDLGITRGQLIKLAKGLTDSKPLTEANWTGGGNPFSRSELGRIRGKLLQYGLVGWVNEKHHSQGCKLTDEGREMMTAIAATPIASKEEAIQ